MKRYFATAVILFSMLFVGASSLSHISTFINNKKFVNSIIENNKKNILLSELTPFKWDYLYVFASYFTEDSIDDTLGFSSGAKESNSEGMNNLVFTRGKQIVCNLYGYPEKSGLFFDFDIEDYIKFNNMQEIKFQVDIVHNIKKLKYIG